jgi:hypothetical protein
MRETFFILACFAISFTAFAQPVLFINAGSRASRGNNQELTIDAAGNCKYRLREVNGPLKDSSSFRLSPMQLDSILQKADQAGFFNLDRKYTGNVVDGAGIYISINSRGKKHAVDVTNTDQPVINELIAMLNRMLEPQRIRINYGQFAPKGRQ